MDYQITIQRFSESALKVRRSLSKDTKGMFWVSLCLLTVLGGLHPCVAQRPSHIIRAPPVRGNREVALIVVPENNLENTAYEELASTLQDESSVPLWICLLDTQIDGDTSPSRLHGSAMMCMEQLTRSGMNANSVSIFIAGHGKGGDAVATYVSEMPGMFRGVILLGTFLKPKYKASTFPVPIMTLSGDLDGITRLTSIAESFRSFEEDADFDKELIVRSPVIIMDGFNHGVFSSGELPGPMQSLDIDSEGTIEDGQRLVANSSALFISNILQYPTSFVAVAKIQFQQAFDKAQAYLKPLLDIKTMTQNTQGESYFIRVAQKWLSGLQGEQSTRLTVENYIVGDATEIPPSLITEGNQSVVVTFSDVLFSRKSTDEEPEAPVEIAARMVSPARIQKELGNTTIVKLYTCRDLNYGSYLTAYHTASETARRRFNDKHRGIIFHTDVLVQSDLAWKLSQLLVNTEKHELHVTAIAYMTPDIEELGERAGLYYCKILPPDRAMEWIYVDSLRRNMPS